MKAARSKRSATPAILPEIRSLIETSRNFAVTTANLALVSLYWNIGRLITEDIQIHAGRADYGDRLLEQLTKFLTPDFGQGFSRTNLQDMRRFFEDFQIRQTVSGESSAGRNRQTLSGEFTIQRTGPELAVTICDRIAIDFTKHHHLSWSHYRVLFSQEAGRKRQFYFEQAAQQRWSVRELSAKIDGALFERVALSRNTRKLVALEKKKKPGEIPHFTQIFKDPYLLDFLGLKGAYSEKDLEASLIRNLEDFLAELGNDFCFIRRQYPMRVDDVDHWLDLLFFHRGLRCLVAIDLKLGAFTAADKGQMDLYLAWLKQHEWRKGENEPVGLILCTTKRRQHVELLLRHGPHKLAVSEYRTQLPDKKLLEDRLRIYGRLLDDAGRQA